MSVLPIRRATAATTMAETLREELLSGAYPPGTPLSEADLVERSGISFATAREALAELARDGLVVHSLHRGVEVARTTPDEVRDIYAARRDDAAQAAGGRELARGRDRADGRGRGRP
jgi:DNA-binding GntR family transcriptional regulator